MSLAAAEKMSWLELVLCVIQQGDSYGTSLKERITELSPEHANSVVDWKHMESITQRIHPDVYSLLDQFMTDHAMSVVPVPASWLRVSDMLLPPPKSTRCTGQPFLTPLQQTLVMERWLFCIVKNALKA